MTAPANRSPFPLRNNAGVLWADVNAGRPRIRASTLGKVGAALNPPGISTRRKGAEWSGTIGGAIAFVGALAIAWGAW